MLIGKQVQFRVDYTREGAKPRKFGTLFLPDGTNVNKAVAEAGWARALSPDQSKGGSSPDAEELYTLSQAAEAAGRGMFSKETGASARSIRDVHWTVPDADALLDDIKGKPQRAIVEHVRDGASLRCLLVPSMIMINFNLAGVQCPRVNSGTAAKTGADAGEAAASGSGGQTPTGSEDASSGAGHPAASSSPAEQPPQPYALEARHFTTVRALHRDVVLHVGGVDKNGNFFGRLEIPGCPDVAEELLRVGLARMVDWSLSFADPASVSAMRTAERDAKEARLRLWRTWAPPTISGDKDYDGVVVEAVSGDTLVVLVRAGGDAVERRVSLSSIRAPRLGRRDEKPQPGALEAKEALRTAVVGREVHVHIDYVRKPPQNATGMAAQERRFGTVTRTTKKGRAVNVSMELVGALRVKSKVVMSTCFFRHTMETELVPRFPPNWTGDGWVELVRHKADEERSPNYDELLALESDARKAKKGIFSRPPPPVPRIADLAADTKQAKSHFPFLQRARSHRGVVEHVVSGGRVKVFLPGENCYVMFAISGVRCPFAGRIGPPSSGGTVEPVRIPFPPIPCDARR